MASRRPVLYLVRWPEGERSLVTARSERELTALIRTRCPETSADWKPYEGGLWLDLDLDQDAVSFDDSELGVSLFRELYEASEDDPWPRRHPGELWWYRWHDGEFVHEPLSETGDFFMGERAIASDDGFVRWACVRAVERDRRVALTFLNAVRLPVNADGVVTTRRPSDFDAAHPRFEQRSRAVVQWRMSETERRALSRALVSSFGRATARAIAWR